MGPLPRHGDSAPLTVGLPHRLRIPAPGMRTHSRVYTFRTRETRTGPGALYTPGAAVFPAHRHLRARRLPPLSRRSLPPRPYTPTPRPPAPSHHHTSPTP